MIQDPDSRRPSLTPQLAVRVTVIGSFALLMFAIIFFRLWFLQVLNSQAYTKQANSNHTRNVYIAPQRGEIVDRFGNPLVESVPTVDIQLSLPDLPDAATSDDIIHPTGKDMGLYRKLSHLLVEEGVPNVTMQKHKCKFPNPRTNGQTDITVRLAAIPCQVATQQMTLPFQNVTVAEDVSPYLQDYLLERQNNFKGVEVQRVYRRYYPDKTLAAQLFGTVGPITYAETKEHVFKGVNENAVVGQSGLELEYDSYLRGTPGNQPVEVNALGQFVGDGKEAPAIPGDTLKLSLDSNVQRAGEAALAQSVASNPPATGGAFVAMDPQNGAIYAMGSNPTYDPTDFTHPMTQAFYKANFGPNSGNPLFNRAIDGAGPDGSTFKVITATAALESGIWTANDTYDDTGQYCFTQGSLCLHNSGHAAYGVVNMIQAITLSDDVFFYHLGALLNFDPAKDPKGGALQDWARKFGIGHTTGVDLPYEASGALPTPDYLLELAKEEKQCENATGPFKGHVKHPASTGGCGISNAQSVYWTIGDNVNTAVGQGDVQVTPLQLAVVYAALANGGTVVKPHLGMQVQSPEGSVLQNFNPPPVRKLHLNPSYLATITTGLRDAASQSGGTSADVMGNFPLPVYGKTGTAEYNGQQDYAWYACYVPATATSRPIVVVVTVEQGGFGAVAAAPVARQILSQWFYGKPGPYIAGTSTTL